MLAIRQPAPDFALPDQNGQMHKLSDYRGQTTLVYFYPKDDTPGCTKEACTIAEVYSDFKRLNVPVLGISADSPESHKKFADKYQLPFTLLSDPTYEVIRAYGAYKEGNTSDVHTKRISFLISQEGDVLKAYPEVDPAIHAHTILADLG